MSKPYVTLLGKAVRYVTRLRGGGSAFPGLFVEKIDPDFVKRTLAPLALGVVVISGTNGKTTTTKMVVQLLESQGLRVFTNRTGSNFARGVAAALIGEVDTSGKLHADIAVLELDEAHAVHFVDVIAPKYSLLLNVMRDQLDRFGEIDVTAGMLAHIASKTTDLVVLNREDPRVASIAGMLTGQSIAFFGLDTSLVSQFPNDDDMHSQQILSASGKIEADVVLMAIDGTSATFKIQDKDVSTNLALQGIYNVYNAAAAITLVRGIVGADYNQDKLIEALAKVTPAFGRGETVTIGGQPLEIVLVKNPSGFRLSLASFPPDGYSTMIAVNDSYADGRDMSWLWDVDFDSLKTLGVDEVSGVRAYEMALRLQYDEIAISHVEPDLSLALRHFITRNESKPKRIYCTYTAMLALRRELGKITTIEEIS